MRRSCTAIGVVVLLVSVLTTGCTSDEDGDDRVIGLSTNMEEMLQLTPDGALRVQLHDWSATSVDDARSTAELHRMPGWALTDEDVGVPVELVAWEMSYRTEPNAASPMLGAIKMSSEADFSEIESLLERAGYLRIAGADLPTFSRVDASSPSAPGVVVLEEDRSLLHMALTDAGAEGFNLDDEGSALLGSDEEAPELVGESSYADLWFGEAICNRPPEGAPASPGLEEAVDFKKPVARVDVWPIAGQESAATVDTSLVFENESDAESDNEARLDYLASAADMLTARPLSERLPVIDTRIDGNVVTYELGGEGEDIVQLEESQASPMGLCEPSG